MVKNHTPPPVHSRLEKGRNQKSGSQWCAETHSLRTTLLQELQPCCALVFAFFTWRREKQDKAKQSQPEHWSASAFSDLGKRTVPTAGPKCKILGRFTEDLDRLHVKGPIT